MTEYEKFVRGLKKPCIYSYSLAEVGNFYSRRTDAIYTFGFAILTEKAIKCLKMYSPILEVGGGTGYWAYEFKKRKIDYVVTDPYPCNPKYFKNSKEWTRIQRLDAKGACRKYPKRTLLICWPSYCDPWATEVLKIYEGKFLIYVGESGGGCTADDEFFEILDKKWKRTNEINIPQWPGIHDFIGVYENVIH